MKVWDSFLDRLLIVIKFHVICQKRKTCHDLCLKKKKKTIKTIFCDNKIKKSINTHTHVSKRRTNVLEQNIYF